MKPTLLRPTLGISGLLLIMLITYRQSANGSSMPGNSGKLFSVTAAARLTDNPNSSILVKGLLRKSTDNSSAWLLDEDSLGSHPQPYICRFDPAGTALIQTLAEDTELVVEGMPVGNSNLPGLYRCTIISINNGTVYADPFPEH
jgi:hypothetical protein